MILDIRLDKLVLNRHLAPSRERAQALIIAGRVMVNEQKIDKPGVLVDEEASLRLLGEDLRYVSRGGLKLEHALKEWNIELTDRACADIGASTGGFTDCMLQHGAASVLAVDTGYGQIAHALRVDPRVTLMERTNARLLKPGTLSIPVPTVFDEDAEPGPEPSKGAPAPGGPVPTSITFFAIDVSFISSTLVLPAVIAALAPAGERWAGEAVLLVKPQFEAGREHVGKGGIVRSAAAHQLAITRVQTAVTELGGENLAMIESPITGAEGNREFLVHARFK